MSNYMVVAQEILKQLGGKQFLAMTGANGFLAVPDPALSFRLPQRGVNYVKITLTKDDLYSLEFSHIAGPKKLFAKKILVTVDGVYAENLQEVFTHHTGLATHL